MNSPVLAAVNKRLTLFSNNTDRHEGNITAYSEVVNHLFRRYTIGTVIAKSDKEIQGFKQGSPLTLRVSPKRYGT